MDDPKAIIKKALKPWLDKAEAQAKVEFEKLAAGTIDKVPMKKAELSAFQSEFKTQFALAEKAALAKLKTTLKKPKGKAKAG